MTISTIGKGKYTYTEVQEWAKPPSGETLGLVSSGDCDSQGRVYVCQRKDPPVLIFDQDGNYLSSWGNGAFNRPHGFRIVNDIAYLTDDKSSVCMMYTLDGKPIQMLGQHGLHSDTGCEKPGAMVPRAAGPFNYPTQMVPDSAGDLYVSDGYRNARIHRFSSEGRLKFSWGEPGTGPGQFHLPHNLLVHEGRVYVSDRQNSRVQVFTTEGEHISTWPMPRPMDICIDKEGILYVSGRVQGEPLGWISVMDLRGNVLAHFDCRGGHGTWIDFQGNIYVGLGRHHEEVKSAEAKGWGADFVPSTDFGGAGIRGMVDKFVRQR